MIKKDKLNIDKFTTPGGKNIRKAEAVDKEKVKKFFLEKGFDVLSVEQLWRHVHGKLKKGKKTFYFKMSSTPDIGERTKNEVSWNKKINPLIKKYNIDYFDVPEIYHTGEYEGRFYYLSSFHEGQFLASKFPPNIKKLGKWIDKIVKSNLFLLSLQDIDLYRDKELEDMGKKWDHYFQKVNSFYQEVIEHDLKEILNEIKNLKTTYRPSIEHGDFVPWHMIKENEKFILIDAEHASSRLPRYYDVCYFYHRVYTSGLSPEIAKDYLRRVKKSLPEQERNKFDESMRPVLARRIIAGFWDTKTDGSTDFAYHNKLKEDFLKNNLF